MAAPGYSEYSRRATSARRHSDLSPPYQPVRASTDRLARRTQPYVRAKPSDGDCGNGEGASKRNAPWTLPWR